jgi:hypothetical protein
MQHGRGTDIQLGRKYAEWTFMDMQYGHGYAAWT